MRDVGWLLDHPDELVEAFDGLTDEELRRLIEARDRRRVAEAVARLRARRGDNARGTPDTT